MGVLVIIIAAITKVTTKVAIYSYVNKIVLTAKIAEHKLDFVHSILSTIIVTRTIGLAINPSQNKLATWSVEP